MSICRFLSRTHRLDASFLMQHLAGAKSYKRIAGYPTFPYSRWRRSAGADSRGQDRRNGGHPPDDWKVAQLRESKMLGRWNERGLKPRRCQRTANANRRLDAFLQKTRASGARRA